MTPTRSTRAWVIGTLVVGSAPCWLIACSSPDSGAAPPYSTMNGTAVSGVGGTGTSDSAGQTIGGATTDGTSTAGMESTSVGGAPATTTGTTTSPVGENTSTGTGTGGGSGNSTDTSTSTSTGVGGAGFGGSGGTTGGGQTTSGATTGGDGTNTQPEASTGCGSPLPSDTCSDSPCNLNGLDYYLDLPDDYDAARPYPVVFQYHPLGGSGQGARTMYRVRPNFPDAIYVSPDGSDNGFPNTGGVDEDMTRSIIADIETKYCIDRARYFATGFSYGGSMSYTAGFCIGDIFRAIAPMAGATISGANSCDPARPVAAWINHGTDDTALPISMSITLRDRLLETNGCSQETMPVDPSPCVAYQGCQAGYPVIWCEQQGVGHAIPEYGATSIAEFFQQF